MPAERAGYTVTMFVIDVSPSMGKTRTVEIPNGPDGQVQSVEMTNLQWGIQYVLLKIQEMIFHKRKTEQCGVIIYGTEDTDNIVHSQHGDYENVTELIPIAQPTSDTLAKLQALEPSTEIGDPIDALIVAVETQDAYLTKKKTWTRKMVILTDAENPIELDEWTATVNKINELNIITTLVGIDFDDEEFGYQQEDKSNFKLKNEEFFHEFMSQVKDGMIGTCAYALQECVRPEVKQVKSQLLANVLRIGDTSAYPHQSREIFIKTSKCTAVAHPPSLKKFSKRDRSEQMDEDGAMSDVYAQLKNQTEYMFKRGGKTEESGEGDENKEEDETEKIAEKAERQDLIKGFKYGTSFASCPDGEFPRLESTRGMDICGFIREGDVRRDWFMGEVHYVWADPVDTTSQVAFSSIIKAMIAQGVAAITRWVSTERSDPKMCLLLPRMLEEVDCFLLVQMPFADDLRRYNFQSLERLTLKSGDVITEHAFLPTDEQLAAMDNFVDAMDLMHAGEKDEEGNRQPWFDPRYSYNPALHRLKQSLFHAAIVSDMKETPLPPPHPEVIKYFEPPRRVLKRALSAIEECKQSFTIKEVPRKAKHARKDGHQAAEEDDGEDLLLSHLDQPSTSRRGEEAVLTTPTKQPAKSKPAANQMDVDSATESESEAEGGLLTPAASLPGLPSTDRYPGRIIGNKNPLKDFKKNLVQGDIVSKAVEDLAFIIKDIAVGSSIVKRKDEMIECMTELRNTCLNEDEIDIWNDFIRSLKILCTDADSKDFWESVAQVGRSLSLISSTEAEPLGGKSNVSEDESKKFLTL